MLGNFVLEILYIKNGQKLHNIAIQITVKASIGTR